MILAFPGLDYIASDDYLAPVRVAITKKIIVNKDAEEKEAFIHCGWGL